MNNHSSWFRQYIIILAIILILGFLVFVFWAYVPVKAQTPGEAYLELTRTKVVWIEVNPQQFTNEDEFQLLLAGYDGNNTITAKRMILKEKLDCDDYAFALKSYAVKRGYDVETELFYKGDYFFGKKLANDHMGCKVYIGNDIYLIDPITLKFKKWGEID